MSSAGVVEKGMASHTRSKEAEGRLEALQSVIGRRKDGSDGIMIDVLWIIVDMAEPFNPAWQINESGHAPFNPPLLRRSDRRPAWIDSKGESMTTLFLDESTMRTVKFDGTASVATEHLPEKSLWSEASQGGVIDFAMHPSGGVLVVCVLPTENDLTTRRSVVLTIGVDEKLGLLNCMELPHGYVLRIAAVGNDRFAILITNQPGAPVYVPRYIEIWNLKTGTLIDGPIAVPDSWESRVFVWNGQVVLYNRPWEEVFPRSYWYRLCDLQARGCQVVPFRTVDRLREAERCVYTSTGWIIVTSFSGVSAFDLTSNQNDIVVLWKSTWANASGTPFITEWICPVLDESSRTLRCVVSVKNGDDPRDCLLSITLPPEMCALPVCCSCD